MTLDRTSNMDQLTQLYNENNYIELVKTSKKILDNGDSRAAIWNFLAIGYRYIGETLKAVTLYETLLKNNPSNFIFNTNAGNLFLDIGRLHDSIKCFEVALSSQPRHVETLFSFALVLTNLGETKQAKMNFKKIIELDPINKAAYFQLGRIYQLENNLNKAIEYFEKTNFDLSKTHQLECYYIIGDQNLYFQKFRDLVKNNSINPLMATIACHAAIRFDRNEINPFCNEPMNYIYKARIRKEEGLDINFIDKIIKIKKSTDLKAQPLLDNGAQSSGNLFLRQEPEIQELKQILQKKIEEYRKNFSYSKDGIIRNWPKSYSLFGWLVSIKSGGKLKAHMHRKGWLSGSIYLKMPEMSGEGNILFGLGLEGSNYPNGGKDYPQKEYEVNEGDIVLFPSSLYHQTLPFSSDKDRISFAFDVIPSRI